jgi:hypothetical protein
MPGPERNRLPAMRTALGTTSAHPPWRCCRGSLHLRSPGESSRLQRHTTRKPWSLCRRPAWPDFDRGGCCGQEAQQETQASEEEAQAAWWAIRRPGTQRTVSDDRRIVCSRPIPAMLRWSAMRPDGRERRCRDLLLRAGGDVLHLCRILLLRHLRLSRRRRHVRSLPGPFLHRHTAMLRRSDLQQRILRRLPGSRCVLYGEY